MSNATKITRKTTARKGKRAPAPLAARQAPECATMPPLDLEERRELADEIRMIVVRSAMYSRAIADGLGALEDLLTTARLDAHALNEIASRLDPADRSDVEVLS